jgi:signal transduction histidine kinase
MEFTRIIKQMINGQKSIAQEKVSKSPLNKKAVLHSEASLNSNTLRLAKIVGWEYDIEEDCLHYTPGIMDWLFASQPGRASLDELSRSTPPPQQESLRRKIDRAISGGTGFEAEIKKYTAEGKEKWVRVSCQTERTNGRISKLLGTVQDITLQKRKELRTLQQHLIIPYKLLQRSQWEHENELGRIAVEVHENISQVLIVARNYLQIDLFETLSHKVKPERGIRIVEKAIHQLKELYERIDIPPLLLLGLEGALAQLIDRYSRQTPAQLTLAVYDEALEQADELTKLCLLRLVKELLNNIRVHAQASEAWVSLEKTEEGIRLMVKDDGVGFYPDKEQWRTGLRRVEITSNLLGGNMQVYSSPGKGCDVMVTLPFSAEKKFIN